MKVLNTSTRWVCEKGHTSTRWVCEKGHTSTILVSTESTLRKKDLNLLLHIRTLLPQWFFQTSLVYLRLHLEIRWF